MFGKGEICHSMEKENHIIYPKLNDRELVILRMVAEGRTSAKP